MKNYLTSIVILFILALTLLFSYSCGDQIQAKTNSDISPALEKSKITLSEEWKAYWFGGEAEITTYSLKQARYGELRQGHAALIFVTEPFLPEIQVKADRPDPESVSVLKLNSTKNYLTGIYPYSIMSSTFYPVSGKSHALKVSGSIQEWCGHVYSQINNRDQFEFTSHSYFEGEADQELALPKSLLENELWNMIRVSPEDLPLGELEVIPSLEYIRTAHIPARAYRAKATLESASGLSTYTLAYPDLDRTLSIVFTAEFPHSIEQWSDSFRSGFGAKASVLTSTAVKLKRIKEPYWRLNGNKDLIYRDSLGL